MITKEEKIVDVPQVVPDNFKKEGVRYKLLYHNLVTERAKVGSKVGVGTYALLYEDDAKVVGYAVVNFRVKLNRFDSDTPYVAFPSLDTWGKDGFSKYTYQGALSKYKSLEEML